jgi:hypothetical protein
MKTTTLSSRSPRRAASAGFTLIAVLMALCVMAGLVAAYGRHVIVSGRSGMASPRLLAARESCHSGLTLARQTLLSGSGAVPATVPAGDGVAGVSVTVTADGHEKMYLQSMGQDGLGAKRTAELAMQPVATTAPSGPSGLPTLSSSTASALLANPAIQKHHITTNTTLTSTDLSDLYIVHPGVQLTLSDVVLHGAVISSTVLDQATYGAFNAATAPKLVFSGNVRIDPIAEMPGVTVVMPDGQLSNSIPDLRVQLHGDVVAHDLTLTAPGVLEGHVAGVHVSLAAPALLDRMGFDRKEPTWSGALKVGIASEPLFLATVPPNTGTVSLSGIMGYWTSH